MLPASPCHSGLLLEIYGIVRGRGDDLSQRTEANTSLLRTLATASQRHPDRVLAAAIQLEAGLAEQVLLRTGDDVEPRILSLVDLDLDMRRDSEEGSTVRDRVGTVPASQRARPVPRPPRR